MKEEWIWGRRNGEGRTRGVEEGETVVRIYGKSIIIKMYKGEKSAIKDHILSYPVYVKCQELTTL